MQAANAIEVAAAPTPTDGHGSLQLMLAPKTMPPSEKRRKSTVVVRFSYMSFFSETILNGSEESIVMHGDASKKVATHGGVVADSRHPVEKIITWHCLAYL